MFTDLRFKLDVGGNVRPPNNAGANGGSIFIGKKIDSTYPNARALWGARLIFGAADQTATVDLFQGVITPSAAGVLQKEIATVTAEAGCTAPGNLNVIVTGAGITGSPLAVPVPLTPAAHKTPFAIAAAIATKLAATPAIAAVWNVSTLSDSREIIAEKVYPAANDGTFNIAMPGNFGVTAAPSSGNTVAGVAGVVIHRIGGNGNDAFGVDLPYSQSPVAYVLDCLTTSAAAVVSEFRGRIPAGSTAAWSSSRLVNGEEADTITAGGKAMLDLIVITDTNNS